MPSISPVRILFKTCPLISGKQATRPDKGMFDSLKSRGPLMTGGHRYIWAYAVNSKTEFTLNVSVSESHNPGQIFYLADLSFRCASEKQSLIAQPMNKVLSFSNNVILNHLLTQEAFDPKLAVKSTGAYEVIEMLSVKERSFLNMIETFNSFVSAKPEINHITEYIKRLKRTLGEMHDAGEKERIVQYSIAEIKFMQSGGSSSDKENAINELHLMLKRIREGASHISAGEISTEKL